MKPIWIIETNCFLDGNPEKLIELAKENGNEIIVTDMDYMNNNKIKAIKKEDCVVCYGSINMALWLMQKNLSICWFDRKSLDCISYYSYWGDYITQREYGMYTWLELKRLYYTIYHKFSINDDMFIRPCNSIKTFTGAIIPRLKFNDWYKQTEECYNPSSDMLVVVAEPQRIIGEWRFVIVENKVITYSKYTNIDLPNEHDSQDMALNEFVQKVITDNWSPDNAYTLDICQTDDGWYSLLEIGSVNTSALYNCDCKLYFEAINSLAIKEWNDLWGK